MADAWIYCDSTTLRVDLSDVSRDRLIASAHQGSCTVDQAAELSGTTCQNLDHGFKALRKTAQACLKQLRGNAWI